MKPFVTGEVTITRPDGTSEVLSLAEWFRRHPPDLRWAKGQGIAVEPRRYGYGPRAKGIDGRFGRGRKRRLGWSAVSPPEGDAA